MGNLGQRQHPVVCQVCQQVRQVLCIPCGQYRLCSFRDNDRQETLNIGRQKWCGRFIQALELSRDDQERILVTDFVGFMLTHG